MAHRDPSPVPDDLYDLLQVSPRADIEVIEAAYRVLARRYHPDVNRSPDATATMARLNAAWDTLRDPDQRAAYDLERNGRALTPSRTGPSGWAARVAADRDVPAGGPSLHIAPEQLTVGPLRQGLRPSFALTVETEPPGIRVTVRIAAGNAWLAASPAVLKGLEKENVTVEVRTRRLRPGAHRGIVELSTSWETRPVPVEVEVSRASIAYRLAAAVRAALANPMVLGVGTLLVIIALLIALAVH